MSLEDQKLWDFHELKNREIFRTAQPRLRFVARKVSRLISSGRTLDVGFGDGNIFSEIYKHRKNIALRGVDISLKNVQVTSEALRKKGVPAELCEAPVDALPFPDNFFDIVTTIELIEHLDNETLQRGLAEISRVLKNGGYLIITTPANEHLEDSICYCSNCGATFHRWGHKQSFSREKIKHLMSKYFSQFTIRKIKFLEMKKPTNGLWETVLYYIKLIPFHLLKPILPADYHWYIQAKK